jgi:hypothetical protein
VLGGLLNPGVPITVPPGAHVSQGVQGAQPGENVVVAQGSQHGSATTCWRPRHQFKQLQPLELAATTLRAASRISLFMDGISDAGQVSGRGCGSSNSTSRPAMCKRNARFFGTG